MLKNLLGRNWGNSQVLEDSGNVSNLPVTCPSPISTQGCPPQRTSMLGLGTQMMETQIPRDCWFVF